MFDEEESILDLIGREMEDEEEIEWYSEFVDIDDDGAFID